MIVVQTFTAAHSASIIHIIKQKDMIHFPGKEFYIELIILFTLLSPAGFSQTATNNEFEVLGLGGAGGMYTPVSSPTNPDLMFVSCDMSGSYRSKNGGKTWQMIHSEYLHSSRSCRPLFIGDTIYWISQGQLKYSTDQGETWQAPASNHPPFGNRLSGLACIPGPNPILIAGADNSVFISENGGSTWKNVLKADDKVNALAATENAV